MKAAKMTQLQSTDLLQAMPRDCGIWGVSVIGDGPWTVATYRGSREPCASPEEKGRRTCVIECHEATGIAAVVALVLARVTRP